MKKVPQRQKGLTVTGTVGEFASLTAEANYGLKPCLGMGGGGGGGSFRAFAFTRLCSTTLGGIFLGSGSWASGRCIRCRILV